MATNKNDNTTYTYKSVDGTTSTIRVGENGVTEDMIILLKAEDHKEELQELYQERHSSYAFKNAMRRYYQAYNAAAESPEPAPEVEGDQGLPNAVDLYFPANPTTGYTWTAEVDDPAVAEVEDQYYPDSAPQGMVGVGGRQWYRIHGLSEGVTNVTFRYGRSWEDKAYTTYLYRIQVDAKRNVLIWGVEVDPKGTDG